MQAHRGWRRCCALAGLALALYLGSPASLRGATARLLTDANPAPPNPGDGAGYLPPSQFTVLGGRAFFFVSLSTSSDLFGRGLGPGAMLWATDGTEAGTELIAGFCTDEVAGCQGAPEFVGRIGDVVLFEVPRSRFDFDRELWRTDGTREGTVRLHSDICQDFAPQGRTELAVAGGSVFFSAATPESGCELWRSDGTVAGTRQVSDLLPGAEGSRPYGLAVLRDRAFFTVDFNPEVETGLWVTDGTSKGTALVRGFPFVALPTPVGNRIFFIAPDAGTPGFSLWTSDGTAAGTRQVRHFAVYEVCEFHDCTTATRFLQPDGDGVLFVADDGYGPQLWRSNGTAAGTRRLTGIASPEYLLYDERVPDHGAAVRLPGSLLFLALSAAGEVRLWTSHGRTAWPLGGCPQRCPVLSSGLQPVPGGRRAVFAGQRRGSNEVELWSSDGTAAGTHPVRDLCPGHCSSSPTDFVTLGDAVYFTATDENGPGLWRTDGTAAGTVFLSRATFRSPAFPDALGGAMLGDQALLGLTAGSRVSELWISGGSEASTRPLATFDRTASSSSPDFASLGDRVVFTTWDGADGALWSSDGITTQRLALASVVAGEPVEGFSPPVVAGGRAFTFAGYSDRDGIYQGHLVTTDGTPEGTQALANLSETFVREPHEFGGRLVFAVASADLRHWALWSSDGTPAGTRELLALPVVWMSNLQPLGGFLYFFAYDSLYRTDGTAAGTTRFGDFWRLGFDPEVAAAGGQVYFTADGILYRLTGTTFEATVFAGREVMGLTELDGRLLFFGIADGDTPQRGLWSTDGTAAGTVFLAPASAQPPGLELGLYGLPAWSRAGRNLLVRGWDPDHGFELWSTDGTSAGTVRQDLAPGSASSFPASFAVAAGRVWFTANSPAHGREVWVSDGTPAGTHQVDEIAPGMFSALPTALTPAGGNLFFSAYTPLDGREPWELPLAGVP